MKVVLFSGGGGGARFARGLDAVLAPGELTVVGNVGDDLEILGLHISPDLDSLVYTLGGLIDDERGWGRAGETWAALESAAAWGGTDWFRLGDRDLGLHLARTEALRAGTPLSEVTQALCRRAGLASHVVPATEDPIRTHVTTPAGRFGFQEWYVGRRHADEVDAVDYEGAPAARPAPGVLEALAGADAILIAPSNPYLSIGPILAVPAIRAAVEARAARCVAVSPLVGGRAVSGPLDRMLTRMAGGATHAHVAALYAELIDELVVDDAGHGASVPLRAAPTRMRDRGDERRLAETVLGMACA